MENRDKGSENLVHAQRGESAKDNNGAGDVNWQTCNLLSLDGGGIRGLWTLWVLQKLFEHVGREEENQGTYHSFHPQEYPDDVSKAPRTAEEEARVQAAFNRDIRIRSLPLRQRYLPCHYFDLICGTSTGALIAIMLGRFRMTVDDCIFEYRRLGQKVFGNPRMISALRFGLGVRHKYKAARLEEVFKDVSKRRDEKSAPGETTQITFPSGRGLCATFVTTMKSEADRRSSKLHLLRSYDHVERDSPDLSRKATPRSTMHQCRTDTNISLSSNAPPRRKERNKSEYKPNYGKASQFEIWKVARAATAAKFYFEPLRIEDRDGGFVEFTDAGLKRTNNPTQTGTQEIEDLHGSSSIGIVVSVGTARKLPRDAKKANFFSTIPNAAREFANEANDPEDIHKTLQQDHDKDPRFPYYRLNDPGGLQTELDEWLPKRRMYNREDAGSKTIDDMNKAFSRWASEFETGQQLQECAEALVACRRKRMSTRRWERYATGSHYECRVRGCEPGDIFDRTEFEDHLSKHHLLESDELEEEVNQCRKHWRYQA